MARPPFDDGADHDSETCVFPPTPATLNGAVGTACGVTALVFELYELVPAALTPATLKM